MPTYDYKCTKCGKEFQEFQKMSSKPVAKCPKCGAKAERQMSAGAGLVFKGSGFYLTDYGRGGQKKPAAEGGSESKSESKSDSKGESKSESKAEFKPSDVKPKKKKDD